MRDVLAKIQSGEFARKWLMEAGSGSNAPKYQNLQKWRNELESHSITEVGEKLRLMMPWISKNKIVDKTKN